MTDRQTIINKIKENVDKLGISMDCSRYEKSYGGYQDAREWAMKYQDKEIDIDEYLKGISFEKLVKIAEQI